VCPTNYALVNVVQVMEQKALLQKFGRTAEAVEDGKELLASLKTERARILNEHKELSSQVSQLEQLLISEKSKLLYVAKTMNELDLRIADLENGRARGLSSVPALPFSPNMTSSSGNKSHADICAQPASSPDPFSVFDAYDPFASSTVASSSSAVPLDVFNAGGTFYQQLQQVAPVGVSKPAAKGTAFDPFADYFPDLQQSLDAPATDAWTWNTGSGDPFQQSSQRKASSSFPTGW